MSSAVFDDYFATLPLIAILRGVQPDEVVSLGAELVDCGFRLIEVPLNSTKPFESIAALAHHFGDKALIGAGTVTRVEEVHELQQAGGRLLVMPHADTEVIKAGIAADMAVVPGVMTPTEAYSALQAGVQTLKLFPAELLGANGLKAIRSVLPQNIPLVPSGGVTPENMDQFWQAGAQGFGLGSGLYRPGMSAQDIRKTAEAYLNAWQRRTR